MVIGLTVARGLLGFGSHILTYLLLRSACNTMGSKNIKVTVKIYDTIDEKVQLILGWMRIHALRMPFIHGDQKLQE